MSRSKLCSFYLLAFLSIALLASCSSAGRFTQTKNLEKQISDDPFFEKAFSAFVLFDPLNKETLLDIRGDKLFIPASNTKIATLLASLEILGDSMPFVRYYFEGDSLYFSGTANPVTLNPLFTENDTLIRWLARQNSPLVYVATAPAPPRFGSGWAWDDYLDDYQTENTALPMYGNLLHIRVEPDTIVIIPETMKSDIRCTRGSGIEVHRPELTNEFEIVMDTTYTGTFSLPLHITDSLIVRWLEAASGKRIIQGKGASDKPWTTLYTRIPDSLYIRLMHESDNFIAEQLLLMCSFERQGNFDREQLIENVLKNWSAEIPVPVRWVDGSGLSRYNLFMPQTFIRLLYRIYQQKPLEWIHRVFPSGGKQGTIEDWYFPYVFAKTGSLSNNHNLSGFIEVKSGKILIFSFMHNHFLDPTSSYKKWMEKKLQWIHENY